MIADILNKECPFAHVAIDHS